MSRNTVVQVVLACEIGSVLISSRDIVFWLISKVIICLNARVNISNAAESNKVVLNSISASPGS